MSAAEMEELPEGWNWTKIADITSKVGSGSTPRGGSASYHLTGIPLVRSMNVHFSGFEPEGLAFLSREQAEQLKEVTVQSEDVLLNITGASIGRVCQVPENMAGARVNQHVCIIRLTNGILPVYLAKYLSSPTVQQMIGSEEYGVTRQALTKGQILDFDIPVPPLAEQRRIVAAVERMLGRVSAARDRLNRVPATLKRFRQAVLAAACSGRLTVDWREENPGVEEASELLQRMSREVLSATPQRKTYATFELEAEPFDLPSGWQWASLGDLCVSIQDGDHQPPPKAPAGVPFVTISNMSSGSLDLRTKSHAPESYYVDLSPSKQPRHGDILYSVTGSFGLSVLVDSDQRFIFQRHIALVRPHPSVHPHYLHAILSGPSVLTQATHIATGIAQLTVPLAGLRCFRIPVPPLNEQHEIGRRVGELLDKADAIEAKLAGARRRVEGLTQAVLAKAFRGELVPTEAELARREGRDYEPASDLLERVRAERQTTGTSGPDRPKRFRRQRWPS